MGEPHRPRDPALVPLGVFARRVLERTGEQGGAAVPFELPSLELRPRRKVHRGRIVLVPCVELRDVPEVQHRKFVGRRHCQDLAALDLP